MSKGFTDEDDALLAELGVEIETKKIAARTPREERIIAGFEEIQRFVDKNGRVPGHGDDKDATTRISLNASLRPGLNGCVNLAREEI